MPDVEVSAAPAATPAEATAPAPAAVAPAAETPPAPTGKRGRATDGERIAKAAEELEKLQSKTRPFDPSKGEAPPETPSEEAHGGGESEAEAAAKTPDEAGEDGPKEVATAEYYIMKRRRKQLEKREHAIAEREGQYQQLAGAVQEWQAGLQLLRSDPKAFWAQQAKAWGSDFTAEYEKLANAYISDGAPDAKLDGALKEIGALKEELKRRDTDGEKQRAEAQRQQAIGNFLRVAVGDEHKSTAFTFRRYGEATVVEDALQVGHVLARELGRVPTDAELAKRLDLQYRTYYKEIADSHSGLSQPPQRVAERVNGAEQPAKPVAPKAPKTLTNGSSAERGAPPRKLTEKERFDAAVKLLG